MNTPEPVPIIDLRSALEGPVAAKAEVSAEIARALGHGGFMIVTGHGLDDGSLDEAARVSRAFFGLPLKSKRALRSDLDGAFRGYIGIGDETVSYTLDEASPPDLKESFVMGHPSPGGDTYVTEGLGRLAFAPNRWPSGLPGFRPALETAYRGFEGLASDLMRLCALGLGLDEDWFDDKFDRHCSTFRATWYPPQETEPAVGQLRAGAHTDYTALTILRLEDVPGGLQFRRPCGEWADVPAVPGGFVVNAGDLLGHWTNDLWPSALHRVANPPSGVGTAKDRLSLLYFVNPNHDALMECIPTCTGPDAPPKYPPVRAGEHRRLKIAKSMQVASDMSVEPGG